MTKEIVEVKKVEENLPMELPKEFKGYSIEELRYQRALIALRKDFCTAKILENFETIRKRGIFGGNGESKKGPMIGSVAKKLISGLGYLDYIMIGVSLFGTGKKVFDFFRGRKRK